MKNNARSRALPYKKLLGNITRVLDTATHQTSLVVNKILATTYWDIGRQIVEFEQKGEKRAAYGQGLLKRLSRDLSGRRGRGFSERNLEQMRLFYLLKPISQTVSAKSDPPPFPLSWSQYVLLLSIDDVKARAFYESETLRGGWSVRQLDRQIGAQFYERTLLSKNKASMFAKNAIRRPSDHMTPEDEIKDPYVLEFLSIRGRSQQKRTFVR